MWHVLVVENLASDIGCGGTRESGTDGLERALLSLADGSSERDLGAGGEGNESGLGEHC